MTGAVPFQKCTIGVSSQNMELIQVLFRTTAHSRSERGRYAVCIFSFLRMLSTNSFGLVADRFSMSLLISVSVQRPTDNTSLSPSAVARGINCSSRWASPMVSARSRTKRRSSTRSANFTNRHTTAASSGLTPAWVSNGRLLRMPLSYRQRIGRYRHSTDRVRYSIIRLMLLIDRMLRDFAMTWLDMKAHALRDQRRGLSG